MAAPTPISLPHFCPLEETTVNILDTAAPAATSFAALPAIAAAARFSDAAASAIAVATPNADPLPDYIFCNEERQAETISELTAIERQPGHGHLGFACWLNFDIIAATHPKYAILCDINPKLVNIYDILKETVLSSSNREEFVENIRKKLGSEIDEAHGLCRDDQAPFEQELRRQGGWLSTDVGFEYVKNLYRTGAIEHRILDATSTKFVELFNRQFQTIYASNIREWLSGTKAEAFESNMRNVISPRTCFIDAFYPTSSKKGFGPPLRLTKGRFPSYVVEHRSRKFKH
jgi:hypothetical protein